MYVDNGRVGRIAAVPGTTIVQLRWDANRIAGDRGAGFALRPDKEGGQAIVAGWHLKPLACDTVVDMAKADPYQRAVVSIYADAVSRNEAALAALTSNFPLDARYEPKDGTFDLVIDRPGTEADLRYVGLLEAAPAPIRDILRSAQGFRRHF